jgi:hypothetical protein
MARLITAMDGNAAAVVCATVPVPGLEYAAEALVVKGIGGAAWAVGGPQPAQTVRPAKAAIRV